MLRFALSLASVLIAAPAAAQPLPSAAQSPIDADASPTITSAPLAPLPPIAAAPKLAPLPSAVPIAGWAPPSLSLRPPFSPRPLAPATRPRWEAIVPGVAALVGGYVGWAATALGWHLANTECGSGYGFVPSCSFEGPGPDGADLLRAFVPIVGPWWTVAESTSLSGTELLVPIAAGVLQAAGAIALITGLVLPVDQTPDLELRAGLGTLTLAGAF